jgi:uncharacterized repeat protein (TIGR01451 family)
MADKGERPSRWRSATPYVLILAAVSAGAGVFAASNPLALNWVEGHLTHKAEAPALAAVPTPMLQTLERAETSPGVAASCLQIYTRDVLPSGPDEGSNIPAETPETGLKVATGEVFQYIITVTNNGSAPASGVIAYMLVPDGVELVRHPAERSFAVALAGIAPGSSKSFTATMRVTATVGAVAGSACIDTPVGPACDAAWVTAVTTP